MTRPAVIVEASVWEAMQAQLAAFGARLERIERTSTSPVGRLTPREVGRLFHFDHNRVRDACKSGELVAEQTDKGWLIAPADAERWWSIRMKSRRNQ